jgi:hypothetical protein
VLGLIISAGLYFAYLWPSVEPEAGDDADAADADHAGGEPATAARTEDAASPAP